MLQQETQQRDGSNKVDGTAIVYVAAKTLAACLWPFMRRGFGVECPGLAGLLALGFMLIYAVKTRTPAMLWYMAAWLVMVAYRRLETFRLVRSGVPLHSRYAGFPWLGMKLPTVKTVAGALNAEIVLCLAAGVLLRPASEAVGGFFLLSGFGLTMVRIIDVQATKMRVQRMRDAEIEQRYLADLYRNKRNDY
jgi:hypothetical protein